MLVFPRLETRPCYQYSLHCPRAYLDNTIKSFSQLKIIRNLTANLINFCIYFPECIAKIDLAFLIDGSGSVGRGNFRRCLSFIQNVVRGFKISPRYTRIAAEVYSSTPRRTFSFTRYSNAYQVLRAVGSIKYPRGGTKTGKALWDVLRYIYRGKTSRKRVLVVLTDGRSQDHVVKPARALKRANVEIFSVGVGRGYSMTQLNEMATDRSHVFTVDFRNLNSIIKAIKKKACKGKDMCKMKMLP